MRIVHSPLAPLALLVVTVALPAAACSGAGQPPTETFRAPGSSAAPGTAAASAPAASGQTVQVSIANFAFDPATLTIPAGTTVVWTNKDQAPHSVASPDGGFQSSGNLANGNTYQYTFNTPGTFAYVCGIHSSMKATVVVTSGTSSY